MAILNTIDIGDERRLVQVDHDPVTVETDVPVGSLIQDSGGVLYIKFQDTATPKDDVRRLQSDTSPYTVGPAGLAPYQSIQDAIDAASSGDTVWVLPGTYTENLTLKNGVDIRGVVSPDSTGGVPKVTVSGYVVQITGTVICDIADIYFSGPSGTDLISVADGATVAINIYRCRLRSNEAHAIKLLATGGLQAIFTTDTLVQRLYTAVDGPTISIDGAQCQCSLVKSRVDGPASTTQVVVKLTGGGRLDARGVLEEAVTFNGKIDVSGGTLNQLVLTRAVFATVTGDHVTVTGTMHSTLAYYIETYEQAGVQLRVGGTNANQFVEAPVADAGTARLYDGYRWQDAQLAVPQTSFLVGPAGTAKYTSIQAAITAASSGDTVWILPGTYTENLTLKDGVTLRALPVTSPEEIGRSWKVQITGSLTLSVDGTATITVSMYQIRVSPTSGSAIVFAGTSTGQRQLNLYGCRVDATSADVVSGGSLRFLVKAYRSYIVANTATYKIAALAANQTFYGWHSVLAGGITAGTIKSFVLSGGALSILGDTGNENDVVYGQIEVASGSTGSIITLRSITIYGDISNPLTPQVQVDGTLLGTQSTFYECLAHGIYKLVVGGANASQIKELVETDDGTIWRYRANGVNAKQWATVRNTFTATADPAVGNDNTQGYAVGSFWFNTSTNEWYICEDASTGAAVWRELTTGSGGGTAVKTTDPTVNDDQTAGYDVGNFWLNTTTEKLWQALDVSTGAAIWWPVLNPQAQVIYVSKQGNDSYDGKAQDRPKLTIGAAITAAGTPASEATAVTIEVLDDGEYDEDLTHVQYVSVYAPYATLKGTQTLAIDSHLTARRLINDGDTAILALTTVGRSYVKCDTFDSTSTVAIAATVSGAVGAVLFIDVKYFKGHTSSTGGGGIFLKAIEVVPTGTVPVLFAAGAGATSIIECQCEEMAGLNLIDVNSQGSVRVTANFIQGFVTTYDVASGGQLRIIAGSLSGPETIASGADVHVTRAGGLDRTQTLYVGKGGNDNLDGLTPDKRKLTIAAAISAAGTPASEAAAVTIVVLDDGEYNEDLTHVQYVNLNAPHATLVGYHILADNMEIVARRMLNDGDNWIIEKTSGTGRSKVDVDEIISTATTKSAVYQAAGTLIIHGRYGSTTSQDVLFIEDVATSCDMIVEFDWLYAGSQNAIRIAANAAACTIRGHVSKITGAAGSTALVTTGGLAKLHLHVDEINCPTAYNIGTAGDELNLFIMSLTGTETRVDATRVRVVKAERTYYTATTNPTINDDANDGFTAGSWWLNTTTEDMWYCVTPSVGAALWKRVIVSSSGVGNQQQILYVGLHGADTADGKAIDDAKRTIGAAITAAGTPANEAAAYTIIIMDDGEYDEDLTHVAYVNLYAPSATLKGKQTLAANMSITARRMINDGDARVIEMTAAGHSYVTAEQISSTSTTVEAIFVNNSSSTLHLASTRMVSGSYRLIQAQDGTIWLEVGSMNAATCIYTTGAAFVRGRVNYITGTDGIINGAGTGSSIDLFVAVLSVSGVAYNITASNFLRMMASRISGTETIADSAHVTVTRAKRNNFVATTDPTVNDDANDGYTVGSVWINTSTDQIFVCMDASAGSADWWPSNPGIVSAEPMGFPVQDDTYTTITWINTPTPTFTIDDVLGSFSVYVKGRKYTFTTPQSVTPTMAEGVWYFYFNASGVLTASQTVWDLSQHAPVALIYWDATNTKAITFADERHGLVMDWKTHAYLHLTLGTRYQNGLGLTGTVGGGGSLDSDAQVNISNGVLWDEDITIPIQDGASGRFTQDISPIAYLPVFYLTGAGALWRADAATAFPVKQGTLRIQYNQFTGGAWTTTDAGQGDHVAVWVMGSSDYDNPIFVILGQRVDGTLSDARNNNTFQSLSLSTLPIAETKLLYRLIFETRTTYSNVPHARLVDIQDLRSISNVPSGTYVAVSHNSTSGRDVYPTHPGESINYLNRQQVLYVGKHGSNGGAPYDGTNPEHAFLTIGAAITAAGTPASEAAAVTIEVLDDGEYDEDLTLVQYVSVHAPLATIKGVQALAADTHLTARRLINDGDVSCVTFGVNAARAFVTVDNVYSTATAASAIACAKGTLYVRAKRVEVTGSGAALSMVSPDTDSGQLIVDVDAALSATGYGVFARALSIGKATVTGRIGRLVSASGTGIRLQTAPADVDLIVSELTAPTAYDAAITTALRLIVSRFSGTETVASGADVHVSVSGGRDKTQVIYASKLGNDNFDGLTPDKAKLTIANAITAAGTPASEAAAVTVEVLDDGEYDEDLTHVSYVNVNAPKATLKGTQTLAASMSITARRFINDGATVVITKATTGDSRVKAHLLWSNGAARLVAQSAGTLFIDADRIEQTADDCVYSANSGTVTRLQVDEIVVPATKYGIDVAGGDVDGHVGTISGGIAIRVATGTAHLSVTEINSTTAYTVSAGATLRMFVGALSGAETVVDTANVRVVKAKRNNWIATTSPTVNDDTNDGYDVGSMWLNTTTRDLWQCISATAAAAVWNLVSRNDIHVAMNGDGVPYFAVKSATYTIAARMTFRGTAILGTPSSARFIARTSTAGGSVDCRIYDVTNAQVIAEYTAITATTFAIYADTTLTNLPTGQAIFEIQVRDTGGQTAEISAASIHWGV